MEKGTPTVKLLVSRSIIAAALSLTISQIHEFANKEEQQPKQICLTSQFLCGNQLSSSSTNSSFQPIVDEDEESFCSSDSLVPTAQTLSSVESTVSLTLNEIEDEIVQENSGKNANIQSMISKIQKSNENSCASKNSLRNELNGILFLLFPSLIPKILTSTGNLNETLFQNKQPFVKSCAVRPWA